LELAKIQRMAFERALWAATPTSGAGDWPCPEGFSNKRLYGAMADAWRAGDPQATAILGRRLLARKRLDEIGAARLRLTLLRMGLFAEAVELTERRAAAPTDGRGAYDRALALAGTDRHELALQTLAQARERGVDPALVEPLAQVLAAETDPTGLEDWSAASAVMETAIRLGLYDAAARQLASELAQAAFGLGPEPDEIGQALEMGRAILRGCGPAEAALVLDAIGPLFGPGEAQASYQAVREVLAGAPDEPAEVTADPEAIAREWLLALACAAAGRPLPAIRRLGRLCGGLDNPPGEMHADLARVLGRQAPAEQPLSFAAPGERRRVFDVFPFQGELAALEIKLRGMASWVDRFVLVEARAGLDGEPRDLSFDPADPRFAPFADKVTRVVMDAFPAHVDTPWAREAFLRDQGLRGLDGACAPLDLVLLSDADEVLDEAVVAAFEGPYATCEVQAYACFLNLRREGELRPAPGAAALQARFLAGAGAGQARLGLRFYCRTRIADAGWRFTGLGGDPGSDSERAAVLKAVSAGALPPGFVRAPLDERFARRLGDDVAGLILGD
jgi:hypothetical protein